MDFSGGRAWREEVGGSPESRRCGCDTGRRSGPDAPLISALLRETWTACAMSWAGAAFDLTVVGWLLWRRSKPRTYAVLAAFHVLTGSSYPPSECSLG